MKQLGEFTTPRIRRHPHLGKPGGNPEEVVMNTTMVGVKSVLVIASMILASGVLA